MTLRDCLAVAIGSALGAMLRHGVSDLYGLLGTLDFPWDTLLANTLGSLLIGWLAALTAPEGPRPLGPRARLFLMGGICGGFTTFSVFSLETVALMASGAWAPAAMNISVTLTLCLLLTWAGYGLAQRMARRDVARR
ncbi:fluoride efflux transporter FluC [Aquisalimonas asiatica]|uniref:Fluoride-specific ion channel FluC n=1 Tax=Aquisalimonas asiatica TaxID=406100 RepID=A0A1H8PRB9_9GAMM|nr:CrcB family protein [Aquisalimonas asiatica]SEO44083.1 camphor resistance protein CrcB [Aquisalimonas asiatica]